MKNKEEFSSLCTNMFELNQACYEKNKQTSETKNKIEKRVHFFLTSFKLTIK
jgi:hypothetical protein